MASLDTIPDEHRDAVQAGVTEAFGASASVGLERVTGGASGALTYRIDVDGSAYLLRVETRRGPVRNPHQYVCMQTAADAGIAPPLRHLDAEAGVAIMDFIEHRPLSDHPGGPAAVAGELGNLVARMQETPAFPELYGYLAVLQWMVGHVRGSGVFAEGVLDPHLEGFEKIREAYRWDDSGRVSSHNDPNPRNLLFDGERVWLIDWETAYRNDPLTDVAILVDNFAPTPELEDALLLAWLGRAPDRVLRARLFLMRLLTRLNYAMLGFSLFAREPRSAPISDLSAMTPAQLTAAVARGELRPASPEVMHALGKMCLAGFLAGTAAPEFTEALAIAGEG